MDSGRRSRRPAESAVLAESEGESEFKVGLPEPYLARFAERCVRLRCQQKRVRCRRIGPLVSPGSSESKGGAEDSSYFRGRLADFKDVENGCSRCVSDKLGGSPKPVKIDYDHDNTLLSNVRYS